jgi:undecaprenyl diphosphate synthase
VRRTIEAASELGVDTLTLYAFSSDNWRRPAAEVRKLMELLERYLRNESARCLEHGVRINVIGRRDRLPRTVVGAIEEAEARTAAASRLHLRLAVDYSGRYAIAAAAAMARSSDVTEIDPARFSEWINHAIHSTPPVPEVDLLIRTSGEQRLSDFLLWEVAYAELFFTDVLWPSFGKRELKRALREFGGRERRFGGLLEHAV